MESYLRELKAIADALFDVHKPVMEDDLIMIALHGLPPEYNTFVTTLINSREVLTWNSVYQKLIAQEVHLKFTAQPVMLSSFLAYAGTAVSNAVSQQSGQNQSRGRGAQNRKNGRGRGRGHSGSAPAGRGNNVHVPSPSSAGSVIQHMASKGQVSSNFVTTPASMSSVRPLHGSPSSFPSSPYDGLLGPVPLGPITQCQICNGIGHIAVDCSQCFNHAMVASDLAKSFATMTVGETNEATWYPDTAASAHMTPDAGQDFGSTSRSFHQHQ